jgi:histone-lysine N-methyltransferase SETD3
MNIEECNDSTCSSKEEDKIDPALLLWCIANKCRFGDIRAGYVASGWRGGIATEHIPADTCVLRVPRKLLLSCESARLDADLMAAASGCPPLSSLCLLAVHLLHELSKGPLSLWADYLRSLPPSYTTAISLSAAEAAALQVPYAQHQVAISQRAADLRFEDASPVLQKLNLPSKYRSENAFIWALSTLYSRSMFLPTDGDLEGSSAGCLTPFGDLFNYAPPSAPYTPHLELSSGMKLPTTDEDSTMITGDGCLDTKTDEYCIYVRKDYNKGEEIFLCYGRYTNLELLEHYGFVLPFGEGPHDTAILPRHVLPKVVIVQLEAMDEAEPSIHENGNPSWEFLRALRLASLTPAQRKLKSSKIALALNDQKVDDESEIWTMKTLIKACEEGLNKLPTAVEYDEELLRIGKFETEGLQVAVQWRLGYKKILREAREIGKKVLKNLGVDDDVDTVVNGHLANLNIRQPKLAKRRIPAAAQQAVPSAK